MRAAGYNEDHDEYLVQLLEHAVHPQIIGDIYRSGTIPEETADTTLYDEWKKQICNMDRYRRMAERLTANRQKVAPSNTGGNRFIPQARRNPPRANQATTSSAQQATSGGGRTYAGAGEPMQIDRQQQQVRCFNCGKFGHISRNCTQPRRTFQQGNSQQGKQVRMIEADVQPSTSQQTQDTGPAPHHSKKKGRQYVRSFLTKLREDKKEFLVDQLVKDLGH